MTKQEEHLIRLNETVSTISLQTFEDCDIQGIKVAANMLMNYGDKNVLTAQGFIQGLVQAQTLCITWLVTDGYVKLTAKGRASVAELEERAEKRAAREKLAKQGGEVWGAVDGEERLESVGQYL